MTPLRRQAFSPARNAGDCQFDCRGGADQMSIYYDINDIDDQSPEHRVHHRPRVVPPEWESRNSDGKAWVWMWEPATRCVESRGGEWERGCHFLPVGARRLSSSNQFLTRTTPQNASQMGLVLVSSHIRPSCRISPTAS